MVVSKCALNVWCQLVASGLLSTTPSFHNIHGVGVHFSHCAKIFNVGMSMAGFAASQNINAVELDHGTRLICWAGAKPCTTLRIILIHLRLDEFSGGCPMGNCPRLLYNAPRSVVALAIRNFQLPVL